METGAPWGKTGTIVAKGGGFVKSLVNLFFKVVFPLVNKERIIRKKIPKQLNVVNW